MEEKDKIQVIISRLDWIALLSGKLKEIRVYKKSELHHFFGDHPEEHMVRVEISKVFKDKSLSQETIEQAIEEIEEKEKEQ